MTNMMQALMISYPIMSGLVSRLTQHLKSSDRKQPNDALSLLSLCIFFSLKLKLLFPVVPWGAWASGWRLDEGERHRGHLRPPLRRHEHQERKWVSLFIFIKVQEHFSQERLPTTFKERNSSVFCAMFTRIGKRWKEAGVDQGQASSFRLIRNYSKTINILQKSYRAKL